MASREDTKLVLLEMTVKGHKLTPWVEMKDGSFNAEMEDGEVVQSQTLDGLRKALAEKLEKAEIAQRPNVACYLTEPYGRGVILPATYVGKRKGENKSWSSCYMFTVGPSNKETRERLTRDSVYRRALKPDIDITRYKELVDAVNDAASALDAFRNANRFDPTGECDGS